MGGTDDEENLVEVTIEQHAALHKQLWEDLGDERDRLAWLALSSLISKDEILKQTASLGGSTACESIHEKRRTDSHYDVWYRERLSEGQRKRHASGKGYIPYTKGYKHTDETRNKMREASMNIKNSQYGTCWINNGVDNKKIKKEKLDLWLKLGYNKGRINARVAQRQRHLP